MICRFYLVGSVWETAAFIIQVEASFMCYLHLYPEDTDLLRQIVLKTLRMSLSFRWRPRGQNMGATALLYLSQRADSWPSAFILCLPTPESKTLIVLQHRWLENYSSAFSPCFPAPYPELEASPVVCVVFLLFAVWVHHVCNRRRAKSSLLFSSWIICWLALKIYLDTGDSITGKTSKDLPKYNCVHM